MKIKHRRYERKVVLYLCLFEAYFKDTFEGASTKLLYECSLVLVPVNRHITISSYQFRIETLNLNPESPYKGRCDGARGEALSFGLISLLTDLDSAPCFLDGLSLSLRVFMSFVGVYYHRKYSIQWSIKYIIFQERCQGNEMFFLWVIT